MASNQKETEREMKTKIASGKTNAYCMTQNIKTCLMVVLLSAAFVSGNAQAKLYNDGGTLHTDEGSILFIEGDLENKDGATIENDGVIEIAGNLTNDSAAQMINGGNVASTERAYKFIGPSTQVLSGYLSNTSTQYIYNLIVDKQSSASLLQLQTNVSIPGSLVFGSSTTAYTYTPTSNSTQTDYSGQGIIQTYNGTDDYELFVTNSAPTAVMGYAPLAINGNPTDGFIQNRGAQGVGLGGFSRNVATLGSAYVFPVASATNGYNAAALTFTYLGTTPDKIRNMFVDAVGGIGQIRPSCVGCNALDADNNGFNYYFSNNTCNGSTPKWVILDALPTDHGYWSFNGNAGDQYFIETYPNSFPGFYGSDLDDWTMIKKSGPISAVPSGDWGGTIVSSLQAPDNLLTYNRNSGCYMGDGIPGGIFEGFSHFQMARSQTSNLLPVEMLYLTAQAVENKFIHLNWATATEINNSGFKVMRSTDGVTFEQIGWVANKTGGWSTSETIYEYDDNTAQPNIVYYYRLNQVDFDGATKNTNIVNASLQSAEEILATQFFPNPANASTSIIINCSQPTQFNVTLYNMTGQLLMQNSFTAGNGTDRFSFATDLLPQGSYRAVFKSDKQVFTRNLNIIK